MLPTIIFKLCLRFIISAITDFQRRHFITHSDVFSSTNSRGDRMRTDGVKGVNVMITRNYFSPTRSNLIPQKMETKERKKKHIRKNNNVKTQESDPLGI